MKQTCCICGGEDDELFMERLNVGRVRWMCARCYRKANNEVTLFRRRHQETEDHERGATEEEMREWDPLEYDDVMSLCDINECSDCPRMGDDSDGRFEDEE